MAGETASLPIRHPPLLNRKRHGAKPRPNLKSLPLRLYKVQFVFQVRGSLERPVQVPAKNKVPAKYQVRCPPTRPSAQRGGAVVGSPASEPNRPAGRTEAKSGELRLYLAITVFKSEVRCILFFKGRYIIKKSKKKVRRFSGRSHGG